MQTQLSVHQCKVRDLKVTMNVDHWYGINAESVREMHYFLVRKNDFKIFHIVLYGDLSKEDKCLKHLMWCKPTTFNII